MEMKGKVKLRRNSLLSPFLLHSSPQPAKKEQVKPILEGAPVTMETDATNRMLLLRLTEQAAPIKIDLRYVFGAHVVDKAPSSFVVHLFFPSWLSPPSSLLGKNMPLIFDSLEKADVLRWVHAILPICFSQNFRRTLRKEKEKEKQEEDMQAEEEKEKEKEKEKERELPPKRRILILINPFGGSGKAMSLYNQYTKPMLRDGYVEAEVIETKHAGHATEIGKSVDLKKYDVIATMSGDGLLHELINGIMARPDWREAVELPLGIIPAGSGNAHAYAIQCGTVLSATFNLITGPIRKIDLLSTTIEGKVRYSHLSVTYGLIADADYESERFRFFGSSRFTLSAVVRLLNLRKYKMRLSLLSPDHVAQQEAPPAQNEEEGPVRSHSFFEFGKVPASWEVLEGEFTLFSAMNSPYLSRDVCAAPFSDLSDGLLDVSFMTTPSQGDVISLFLEDLSDGKAFATHPSVQHRKVKALYLEPQEERGVIMLDGERLQLKPMKVEVHPSLLAFIVPLPVSFPLVKKP